LFERHPRTLAFTEAGRSYVASIRRGVELISEATEMLRPEPQHLTISVTPTFASKWLIPRLLDFTATHPHIDLRIVASDWISNFQTYAVDLAVRYARPFGPELNADLLFEQVVVAVRSPLLIEKLGGLEDGANLMRHPLLHDANNVWPQFLERAFPQGTSTPTKNIRFNQTLLAIEAVIAGQGLALTNLFFVEDDLSSGRLVRLFATELRGGSDFYIVFPLKARPAGSVAAVRAWLALGAGRRTCAVAPTQ
jgi:LysR family transcriptional regulator, glycine cleavage system transcriptional activator